MTTFIVVTQTGENDSVEAGGETTYRWSDGKTVYHWDGERHTSHDAAILAGWNTHGPDFAVGRVEGGELVWFGWMLNQLPGSDLLEIGRQLGLSARTSAGVTP